MEYYYDEIKKMKMKYNIHLHCLITVIQDITCVIFLYEDCEIFFLFSIKVLRRKFITNILYINTKKIYLNI